jgi:hypothetical protein
LGRFGKVGFACCCSFGGGVVADAALIEFVEVEWSDRVEADLSLIREDLTRVLPAWRTGAKNGAFSVYGINTQGDFIGTVIWSIETEINGGFSIIVNAIGARNVPGVDVAFEVYDKFAQLGRLTGATALRFWTKRRGLVLKTEGLGFQKSYVMELLL